MADPNYGSDLSCTTDLDPLGTVVSGAAMVRERAIRRLISRKGSILSAPFAETIDVRDLLSDAVAPGGAARIQANVRTALLDDECIAAATVQITYLPTSKTMMIAVACDGALGPFAFTLDVGSVTVSVLSR
jgi:hypothetical protein